MPVYIDTSALAKRYVSERGSDAFDAFVHECEDELVISPLVHVEFESVLQRLKREGLLDTAQLRRARDAFHDDLGASLWSVRAFEPGAFHRASELLRALRTPLAALDALHLGSALSFGCDSLASADRSLLQAASSSRLAVHAFVV